MPEAEGSATPGTEAPKGLAVAGTETPKTGRSSSLAPRTTGAAPKAADGQPGGGAEAGKTGAPASGTPQPAEEQTFFDPKTLDPALVPAYKEMQRAFGKKMEALAKDRTKVDAYDAFSKDPVGNLQRMAAQMGYRLSRADAAEAIRSAEGGGGAPDWEPKNWNEVVDRISQAAQERTMRAIQPIIGQVTDMRKQTIEKILDDSCPDWRQYEDEMTRNVQEHPSLVNDPVKLYRLSVPPEVIESRATQAALKKLEGKVKGNSGGGPSKTTKTQATTFGDKPLSFNEAVEAAKTRMAEQGIVRPPGA